MPMEQLSTRRSPNPLEVMRQRQMQAKLLQMKLAKEQEERSRQTLADYLSMAKIDPNVLRSESARQAFGRMGYPVPTAPKGLSLEDTLQQKYQGYGRPTVSVGPRGRVTGATFRPAEAADPLARQLKIQDQVAKIQAAVADKKLTPEVGSLFIKSLYSQTGKWLGGPFSLTQFPKKEVPDLTTALGYMRALPEGLEGSFAMDISGGRMAVKPKAEKEEKFTVISYWDKAGEKRVKRVKASDVEIESSKIIATGGTLEKPEELDYPAGYKLDLVNAVSAMGRGADRQKIYLRIAAKYPKRSAELKRILLYTSADDRLEALKQIFFGGEQ